MKLKRLGYSETYLKNMVNILLRFSRHVNIDDPNEVLSYINRLKAMDSYKANLCDYYRHYAEHYQIPFTKPKYRRDHKLPYVPTKAELDLFIAHSKKKYALIYSILRDTGIRPIELSNIKLKDIDLDKGTINIFSAKYGAPRIVKVKNETLVMLKSYVKEHGFNYDDRLFPDSTKISNTFCRLRYELARKLQNPKLKKIRLYDFRHFFATNLYYETKDILLTKELLGHKNINNTMIYTHLVKMDPEDKFYSATAKSVEEATKLVESGWEYITTFNGVMIFRKRK
ncbi:MAG: site-specific integrase [Candidatus Bathyarchaeia archaeon]